MGGERGHNVEAMLSGAGRHRRPPTDIKPSELILRLQDTKRPSEVLPFVRRDDDGQPLFSYRMMILTPEELDVARANADQYTRKKLSDTLEITDEQASRVRAETWADIYNDALMTEALFEAMRREDDCARPLWDAPSQIRRLLTTDEVVMLFKIYEGIQLRLGPMWRLMDQTEVDAWVKRLMEGAAHYPLESLGQAGQVQLIYSMAALLLSSKTDTGSYGQPTESATSETTANVPTRATPPDEPPPKPSGDLPPQ
jgi:hypothetical protein